MACTRSLFLTIILLSAAGASCKEAESCDANSKETCRDDKDVTGLLQKKVRVHNLVVDAGGFQDSHRETTKYLNGVPIYNYHLVHPESGMQPSLLQLAERKAWVIVFPEDYPDEKIQEFCTNLPGESECGFEGHPSEGGFAFAEFDGSEVELRETLKDHPLITPDFIEPDLPVEAFPAVPEKLLETTSVPWGLDRLDDKSGLDGSFHAPTGSKQGKGAHVYIADTGIRTTHDDFEGRAETAVDYISSSSGEVCNGSTSCAWDRNGHGTHCAGTSSGKKYGVAKKSNVYSLKVLSDQGSGSTAGILKSIDWVASNGRKPAIWSASLGGHGSAKPYESAFRAARKAGVIISVAAGNSNDDACLYSPAGTSNAITVGATDRYDNRASFSNYGYCVDIFAPGVNILSASHSSDTGSATMSGTSMACPHVSGLAAVYLADNPGMTPETLKNELVRTAMFGSVKDAKRCSPNILLNMEGNNSGPPITTTTTTVVAPTTFDCVGDKPCGSGDIRVPLTINYMPGGVTVRFLNCWYAYTDAAGGNASIIPYAGRGTSMYTLLNQSFVITGPVTRLLVYRPGVYGWRIEFAPLATATTTPSATTTTTPAAPMPTTAPAQAPTVSPRLGDDSCQHSMDGVCDEPEYCVNGTDCSDCGNCHATTYSCQSASAFSGGGYNLQNLLGNQHECEQSCNKSATCVGFFTYSTNSGDKCQFKASGALPLTNGPYTVCLKAEATCDSFTGCNGRTPVNKGIGVKCSGNAATCNVQTCCKGRCYSFCAKRHCAMSICSGCAFCQA